MRTALVLGLISMLAAFSAQAETCDRRDEMVQKLTMQDFAPVATFLAPDGSYVELWTNESQVVSLFVTTDVDRITCVRDVKVTTAPYRNRNPKSNV
jgi:hypothetical protein